MHTGDGGVQIKDGLMLLPR